ncbi:hypothetical protein BC833DRAFT_581174 [Globomyces pollinis-pini]|nr:hypothetical protein BC833DRAFT_581174 [Globomyces pollinis-pini]
MEPNQRMQPEESIRLPSLPSTRKEIQNGLPLTKPKNSNSYSRSGTSRTKEFSNEDQKSNRPKTSSKSTKSDRLKNSNIMSFADFKAMREKESLVSDMTTKSNGIGIEGKRERVKVSKHLMDHESSFDKPKDHSKHLIDTLLANKKHLTPLGNIKPSSSNESQVSDTDTHSSISKSNHPDGLNLSMTDIQNQVHTMIKTKSYTLSNQRRWVALYRNSLLGMRLSSRYKNIAKKLLESLVSIPKTTSPSLTTIMQESVINPSESFIHQVENLLMELPHQRSKHTIETLDHILCFRMMDFKKLSHDERTYLCSSFYLEKYPTDTLLIKENHVATFLYVVLTGQVELFRSREGQRLKIGVVNPGHLLGETSMGISNALRVWSAATVTDCKLLCVNKDEYITFLNGEGRKMAMLKILQSIGNIPLFKHPLNFSFLKNHISYFKTLTYEKGQTIQKEGTMMGSLFFIIEGECTVTRNIKILQTKHGLKPYSEHEHVGEHDHILDIKLETQELKIDDCFPQIPNLTNYGTDLKYLGPEVVDPEKYKDFFNGLHPDDPHSFHQTSVNASSTVVVVAEIPLKTFVDTAPKEILFHLIANPSIVCESIQQLQHNYLEKHAWESQKKHVIEHSHKK